MFWLFMINSSTLLLNRQRNIKGISERVIILSKDNKINLIITKFQQVNKTFFKRFYICLVVYGINRAYISNGKSIL